MKAAVLLLCLSVFFSAPSLANDEAKLEALKKDIQRLQTSLAKAQQDSDKLSKELRQSDIDMAKLNQSITATREKLAKEHEQLKKLKQEQGQLQLHQNEQRRQLAQQLRAALRFSQNSPIKILLNQDDPQQAQRMLRYFSYYNHARIARINEILAELKRLDNIATVIAETEQRLRQDEQTQVRQQQQLKTQQQKQQNLLAQLKQSMATEQQQLANKEANRKQLEQLLNEVQTLLDRSPRRTDARPIAQLKGKLPVPTTGKLVHGYGSRQQVSHQNGWLIRASEGSKVHAVHHGRVVFADWLRGYGLVMLLDHGQGYLSLYAHNQTLLRNVGTWVNQGDTIATVGSSGGVENSALYFEIRYKGKPQDPANWLKR